jgi:SAM-dependent methyltransferase
VILAWDSAAATVSGPSRVRLWRPNPFLVEARRRIRDEERGGPARRNRAMDVACGTGRDSVYLALEGYAVLAVDLLPDALQRAAGLASRAGVQIQTAVIDLEHGAALPSGEFNLLTVFRYLHRPLFPALRNAVAPGGYVVYETFHDRNREAGQRPQNPAHLLQTGELARAFEGFEILIARDAVERDGRFFSSLLARLPAT